MKKTVFRMALVAISAFTSMTASAEAASTSLFMQADSAKTDSVKIDWTQVPVYHAEKVIKTDEAGNQMKNEDGTLQYRVFLVDQNGNIRSAAAVKQQQTKVRKLTAKVVGKVGLGVLGGIGTQALSNAISGKKQKVEDLAVAGAAGAVVGLAWSSEDIAKAKELRSSLKSQEKLLKEYEKSFTDEGEPRSAKVDMNKIAGIDIVDNNVSKSAEEVKNLLDSSDFKEPDDSAWDI